MKTRSGHDRRRLSACVAVILLVLGCDSREDPPGGLGGANLAAKTVLEFQGSAPAIAATLLVRVKPAEGEAYVLDLNLWSPADGRVRLSATKVGVSGLEALVGCDGSFLGIPRDGECVRDDLERVFADDLGPQATLARLVEELKVGPVPLADSYLLAGGGLRARDPATGLEVTVALAADGVTAQTKTWSRPDGTPALILRYSRQQVFDGLRRPSVYVVEIPGWAGQCQIRLQALDVVPGVSDDRMRLEPPTGAQAIDFPTFLDRLQR